MLYKSDPNYSNETLNFILMFAKKTNKSLRNESCFSYLHQKLCIFE